MHALFEAALEPHKGRALSLPPAATWILMTLLTSAVSFPTSCSSNRFPTLCRDFCVPQAPAALLKAALVGAGIVHLPHPSTTAAAAATAGTGSLPTTSHPARDLASEQKTVETVAGVQHGQAGLPSSSSSTPLEEQLGTVFGKGGIRITSRSGLPQGSGMGTSSILAGERRPSLACTHTSFGSCMRSGCRF